MSDGETRKLVFVLGDSRTGTMTIHRFLKSAGFRSIHYFFNESGVTSPVHLDRDANWVRFRAFIGSGQFDAFSDYPTRSFFRELMAEYPDASFILTRRKDLETWRRSMREFFAKFERPIALDELAVLHVQINDEIVAAAEAGGHRLCDICIDEDADANGARLSAFLGLDEVHGLGWENSTSAYDNRLWSSRVSLLNTKSDDFLGYVRKVTGSGKAMLSEYGWTYLVNDSSDFLDYCYGAKTWSAEDHAAAVRCLTQRHDALRARNIRYLKFAIPEKPIVYPEFLPKVFAGHAIAPERPAVMLAKEALPFFDYPADVLIDAKSLGTLYFRGDSHANWLGAYVIYAHIAGLLNKALPPQQRCPVIPLSTLHPSMVAYGGDLFTQLDAETLGVFKGAWSTIALGDVAEHLVRYMLPEAARTARPTKRFKLPADQLGDRPLLAFETPDQTRPRAVIFRDSTADFLVDLLAEHFSASVFVWHKGLVYEDIIEVVKPDVVLHIMAERFMTQYRLAPPLARLPPTQGGAEPGRGGP